MAVSSKRTIFRSKALQHYAASRQKDVLPRLVSPPVFVFFWILLGLLLVAGITAWLAQVPTYIVNLSCSILVQQQHHLVIGLIVLNQAFSAQVLHVNAMDLTVLRRKPSLNLL